MMRLIIIVSMKRTILFPFYIPTDSGLRKRSVSTGIDTMPLQRKNVLSILLFVLIVSVLAAKHSGTSKRKKPYAKLSDNISKNPFLQNTQLNKSSKSNQFLQGSDSIINWNNIFLSPAIALSPVITLSPANNNIRQNHGTSVNNITEIVGATNGDHVLQLLNYSMESTAIPFTIRPGVDARPNDNNVSDKLSGKSNIFVRPKRKAENMCNQYINQIFTKISVLQLVADPTVVTVTSDKCTDSNELVVGGEDATPGEFPHQVSLGILRNGTYTHMCGGSLISPLWVLTAAHCIDSPSLQNTEGGITATVAEIIRNPDYKSPSVYNDIALIKLDKAVEFSKNIRPACLHVQYDTVPLEAWVTGWGDTEFGEETGSDTLQKAELKILDSIQCISSYRPSTQLPKGITQHMLCAGDPVGGWAKDSCVGDSGGPLQIIHPENRCLFEVFGITSYGQGCAFPNKPGVYTKVSHYIKWIEDIVWP